jgi:endonuclease/exonuclease/phosphatase family metal-dependent hydrolase
VGADRAGRVAGSRRRGQGPALRGGAVLPGACAVLACARYGGWAGPVAASCAGPNSGQVRTWWFPDEPRAAIAAELDGLTVIGTHLSFAPHTAIRQLHRLRVWSSRFSAPVLVAGDLNLAGSLPAIITGGERLFSGPTFPALSPRLQLDHLLSLNNLTGIDQDVRWLAVGDHRAISATVAGLSQGHPR